MYRRIFSALPALLALVFTTNCSDSTKNDEETGLGAYITGVASSTGVTAALRQGTPTSGTGSTITVTGTAGFIEGGSTLRTLTSSTAFNRVVVMVAGVDGYYELTLSSSVTTINIIITVSQTPPASFTLQYAAGTSTGVGTPVSQSVTVVNVGTGSVQVSVSWNSAADVDLHLVEPGGAEIYYANETSASGGTLDLDSNAGCSSDGPRNENITWPSGRTPPRGTYTVKVDYWSSCSAASTSYVVTVRVSGQTAKTYTGTFTGSGDAGGAGSGVTVATFTY